MTRGRWWSWVPTPGWRSTSRQWEITDEDIGRELKGIQEQNALFTDKESGDRGKGQYRQHGLRGA